MKIKVLLFGSTGMVGKGVLLECLESPQVETVLVVNRKSLGMQHEKLREVIHGDFYDLSPLANLFAGYTTCFFCLGVSALGMTEAAYHNITYELTVRAATLLHRLNKDMTFCYVSGAGSDSSEKGRMMWARVKGKAENALLAMSFKQVYLFRPGYIQPLRGTRSKVNWYNWIYAIFKPLYFILKPFTGFVTDTSTLGKAMITVALRGHTNKIIDNAAINRLGKGVT